MIMLGGTVTILEVTVAGRRAIAALLLAGLVAACGSSAATGPGSASADVAGSDQAAVSQPVEVTPDAGGDTSGGGTGAGTGSSVDIERVATALVPPNSTEITRTTATDTWFVVYETTDSIDSLKSFYEDAIPKTGLNVISTTTVNGGVSWTMSSDDNGTFGGAVNVYPSSDGKNAVQVVVGKS
jgi:hypothetical protein